MDFSIMAGTQLVALMALMMSRPISTQPITVELSSVKEDFHFLFTTGFYFYRDLFLRRKGWGEVRRGGGPRRPDHAAELAQDGSRVRIG